MRFQRRRAQPRSCEHLPARTLQGMTMTATSAPGPGPREKRRPFLKRAIGFLRQIWTLAIPYWRSEERYRAGVLLTSIIALNLAGVGLSFVFNDWNRQFYNALQYRDLPALELQLLRFAMLSVGTILIAVYQTYLRQMLFMRWRRWLTDQYVESWLSQRAYYRLQLTNYATDNPDQRIAEDISGFITLTLDLSLDLLTQTVTLGSFATILWNLSGDLTAFGVRLPGYMLWVALVYAVVGTYCVARIGRPLIPLNFQKQQVEADFRFSLVRVRENAEGMALYGGEAQEARGLRDKFAAILANWWGLMQRQLRLNWFSNSYSQVAIVFPFIVAAPRFFSGAIQLGGLMQTASAFATVQTSLSWFIVAFASLAEWKARVNRLSSFREALVEMAATSERGARRRQSADARDIAIDGLDVWLPDGAPLIKRLTLRLRHGSRTLITGASGSGKSTLIRVIAGLWPYCEGELTLPENERLLFLPQRPYLPIDSLRVVVVYPNFHESYADAEIREALQVCGLGPFADRLDEVRHWGQSLSGGEQQRLAIARALLVRPSWLFLDEATSNLDPEAEKQLYKLIVSRLPQAGIVSVSHHPALAEFHQTHFVMTRSATGAGAALEKIY